MAITSSALTLLDKPEAWFCRHTYHSEPEISSLEDTLFSAPCTQIDFPPNYSLADMKSILLSICSKRGECLDYDNSPYLRVPDYSNQPVEWHFDGISSTKSNRVPDWIFFLHCGKPSHDDTNIHGFTIANCHLVYESLPLECKHLLDSTNQIVVNHRVGSKDTTDHSSADLSVRPVSKISHDCFVFRGHVPYTNTVDILSDRKLFYCYPDDLYFYYENLAWPSQLYLLSEIQNALLKSHFTYRHSFNSPGGVVNSLLAVHNKSCFHGGFSVESGDRRLVERLQLIDY